MQFVWKVILIVLVTAMFSPTEPARLFHPKIAPPYIAWLHGAVFYGWGGRVTGKPDTT